MAVLGKIQRRIANVIHKQHEEILPDTSPVDAIEVIAREIASIFDTYRKYSTEFEVVEMEEFLKTCFGVDYVDV